MHDQHRMGDSARKRESRHATQIRVDQWISHPPGARAIDAMSRLNWLPARRRASRRHANGLRATAPRIPVTCRSHGMRRDTAESGDGGTTAGGRGAD